MRSRRGSCPGGRTTYTGVRACASGRLNNRATTGGCPYRGGSEWGDDEHHPYGRCRSRRSKAGTVCRLHRPYRRPDWRRGNPPWLPTRQGSWTHVRACGRRLAVATNAVGKVGCMQRRLCPYRIGAPCRGDARHRPSDPAMQEGTPRARIQRLSSPSFHRVVAQ